MKQFLPRLLIAILLLLSTSLPTYSSLQAAAPDTSQPLLKSGFAPDRLIVKLDPSLSLQLVFGGGQASSQQAFENLGSGVQVRAVRSLFTTQAGIEGLNKDPLGSIFLLELEPGSDVLHAAQAFSANAAVEWAEPDYLAYPITTTPNDPLFNQQWGLAQINAPATWDITTGSATTVIAMIDSGLQFNHPDLAGKLWVNPGEVSDNGLDDDNNGYIDDLNGWDFVNGDNLPADDNGHGTQTAGVAGAATDNNTGIAGVCWNCTLMPVKVMSSAGVANYSDIAAGVLYAARKGARVINISLGGYSESSALLAAVTSAVETYGAVIVAGAGNDHISTPFYPAAYPQVLAVAASGPEDVLWGESNYGEWVDVVAPGVNIQTTFLGSDYGAVNGTSLSTAFVSGLAGLLRSHNPAWSADMLRAQLLHTAEDIDDLNPGFEGLLGSGRVDAYQALSVLPRPLLAFHDQTVNGSASARPDPGSSVDLLVTLYNDWADASEVSGTLSSSNSYITITNASAAFEDIPTYATGVNITPFQFNISASAPYGTSLSLNLRLTASDGYLVDVPLTVQVASDTVIVDATIPTQTWTNDRIYLINKNSGIPVGNTLTIEPGTEVRFVGDYTLSVFGTLIADGEADNLIHINNNSGLGRIVFEDSSTDAVFDPQGNYLAGSLFQHIKVETISTLHFRYSAPFISGNKFINLPNGVSGFSATGVVISQNEIHCNIDLFDSSGRITENNLIGPFMTEAAIDGITIENGTFEITKNKIDNLSMALAIWDGNVTIRNNLISNNGYGLTISDGDVTITNNTFLANHRGLSISKVSPTIQHNNLSGKINEFVLYYNGGSNLDATRNWWGTTNPLEIEAAIYDGLDQYGLGIVDYSDFLTIPEVDAPAYVTDVIISPDTTLGIQTATFDVKFNREMEQSVHPIIEFKSTTDISEPEIKISSLDESIMFFPNPGSGFWLDEFTFQVELDVTSLIPRDDYFTHISSAVGTDGIEMAPTVDFPFTVDYAGAISDTTPPPAPTVVLCTGDNLGEVNASWSVFDPETDIDLYSYAIGTTPGGSDVVDWTDTTATSFSRTNLNLSAGGTYYVAVKARNAGGLWSEAGIPPGLTPGSDTCTTNGYTTYMPDAGVDQTVNKGEIVLFSGILIEPDLPDVPLPKTITWDFGDGDSVTGTLTPTHVYPEAGVFTATLTLTDVEGRQVSDTVTITVLDINYQLRLPAVFKP
jgi:hypothetical protein